MKTNVMYAVGLDAGSRYTRVVICVLERGRLRFVGAGSAPSEGWVKSRIANQLAVAESVRMAVDEAQAAAGLNVESLVVGMAGQTVCGGNGRGALELGHVREIEPADVMRVVKRARLVKLGEDRMILQDYPQDFVIDGVGGHRNPSKMLASCLAVNVHFATVSLQEHNALIGAVNLASVLVEESVFETQAACYAAVRPEDRREGIAVLDIGAESTGMVVYYGESIQLATTIQRANGTQICGDSFTRDLAQGMTLTFEDAEMVKLEYGCGILAILYGQSARRIAHAGGARATAGAAEARQNHSGIARPGIVRAGAQRTGADRHGAGPDRRHLCVRRRRAAGGHSGRGRQRIEVPGALRPAGGHPGLARGNPDTRVDHRGGAGDVLGKNQGTERNPAGERRLVGESVAAIGPLKGKGSIWGAWNRT